MALNDRPTIIIFYFFLRNIFLKFKRTKAELSNHFPLYLFLVRFSSVTFTNRFARLLLLRNSSSSFTRLLTDSNFRYSHKWIKIRNGSTNGRLTTSRSESHSVEANSAESMLPEKSRYSLNFPPFSLFVFFIMHVLKVFIVLYKLVMN